MPIDHFEQLVTCILNEFGIGSGDDTSNVGLKEIADLGPQGWPPVFDPIKIEGFSCANEDLGHSHA
jgi:hypothetical protein